MFPSQFANIFLTYQTFVTNSHILRVELRCKLQGKLHRVDRAFSLQPCNILVKSCLYYTAKNAQVATSLLTSWNNLLQKADIRMRSHGLRQLVDDKSVASCQQTCCKLIVKTCYQQACCKLFQQVVTSLQMTSCNKPDF